MQHTHRDDTAGERMISPLQTKRRLNSANRKWLKADATQTNERIVLNEDCTEQLAVRGRQAWTQFMSAAGIHT